MADLYPLRRFTSLAYKNSNDLVFGHASTPVCCGFDLTIGAGQVYPEVNFTLPPMTISATEIQYLSLLNPGQSPARTKAGIVKTAPAATDSRSLASGSRPGTRRPDGR